jgi:hypothetical protein
MSLVEPFADVFLHERRRCALDDVRAMSLIYHDVRLETSASSNVGPPRYFE